MDDVVHWILNFSVVALVVSHLWLAGASARLARTAGPRSLSFPNRQGWFRHRWFRIACALLALLMGFVWGVGAVGLGSYDVTAGVLVITLVSLAAEAWSRTVLRFDDPYVFVGSNRYRKDGVTLVPRVGGLELQTRLMPQRLAFVPEGTLDGEARALLVSEGLLTT